MRVLSVCVSGGLWDRAFIERGHDVVAGCEIMPHKRAIYRAFCGGEVLTPDIADLPGMVRGQRFDGVIAGIPCQSRTRLKAMRRPKFGDLLPALKAVLSACNWDWCLAENVARLDLEDFNHHRINAMNYGRPHQSRPRWFAASKHLPRPVEVFPGGPDALLAYPVVAGRIYGPVRGAILQGWPQFAELEFPCTQLQEALADGVPRCLAEAWLDVLEGDTPRPASRPGLFDDGIPSFGGARKKEIGEKKS